MRQRVTIMGPGTVTPDAWGRPVTTPTTLGTFWAEVRPLSGRELVNAQQLRADVSHLVRLRYVSNINATNYLLFNGRQLNIAAAINVEERSRELNLYCTEPNATNTPPGVPLGG